MKRPLACLAAFILTAVTLIATPNEYILKSPDGCLEMRICTSAGISYDVLHSGTLLLEYCRTSMTLGDGTVYGGEKARLRQVSRLSVDRNEKAIVYKRGEVRDNYNEMTLDYSTFKIIFRAYDDACAYRYISKSARPFTVTDEQADFRFAGDWEAYIPYIGSKWKGTLENILVNDFQCLYEHSRISEWKERYSVLPTLVECPEGKKVVITEADLINYPGMFLYNYKKNGEKTTLSGYFARVPDKTEIGGHNKVQELVLSRKDYIAKFDGYTEFPWRVIAVSSSDRQLADSDIVWKLATPAADCDWSWVKPGKVAWEWWNAWNLKNVYFETGVNDATYKYYIDFAAANGIEYVILDEGWAVKYANDLMQIVPEIHLDELISYAETKGIGIILWAGWWPFAKDLENVCRHFSEMGVKGFKVDFMNRDDQIMVDWYRRAAETCAKYHLMIDFHGSYKPTGLQRTFPNVLNFEGVHGLEQMKWSPASVDQVTYDVTIPFIRMLAGPMDYTQGAMRNATKKNYRPVRSEPMSQGTRCRQLAEYVVFESPLNMMCDSPSAYTIEQECTDFIAKIPTVWDETMALDGKVAEYVAIARRSGDKWYVGAMTDWNSRILTLNLGFLQDGDYVITVFSDGVNADKVASDYKKETFNLPLSKEITVNMAPGGGWAAVIAPLVNDRTKVKAPESKSGMAEGANLRILDDNIWDYSLDTIPPKWKELGADPRDVNRGPQFARLICDYLPDVFALQEYSAHMHAVFYPLVQKNGYVIAWESGKDWNNTPIFYNGSTLDLLYVNYNKYTPKQWCNHGSKSFTSAVLKRKSDGKVFALIGTHLWWKSEKTQPGSMMARAAQLRLVMAEADIIRDKFGDIPVFVVGDMNCEEDTIPIQQLIQGGYEPCYKVATIYGDNHNGHHICGPVDGYSVKSRRRGDDRATGAIDHCLLLDPNGKSEVKVFDCIMEDYIVKLTDHYPNLIDVQL